MWKGTKYAHIMVPVAAMPKAAPEVPEVSPTNPVEVIEREIVRRLASRDVEGTASCIPSAAKLIENPS